MLIIEGYPFSEEGHALFAEHLKCAKKVPMLQMIAMKIKKGEKTPSEGQDRTAPHIRNIIYLYIRNKEG